MPSEARVWQSLRSQLPVGWCAWHSVRVRTTRGAFGEADFVIADPYRGLLVLEVKGGFVEQFGGHLTQDGRPMRRSPLQQALSFVPKLASELRRVVPTDPPHIGVACAFPDVAAHDGPTNSDLRGLVIDGGELEELASALDRAFEANRGTQLAPRCACWMEALHELWGGAWTPEQAAPQESARA